MEKKNLQGLKLRGKTLVIIVFGAIGLEVPSARRVLVRESAGARPLAPGLHGGQGGRGTVRRAAGGGVLAISGIRVRWRSAPKILVSKSNRSGGCRLHLSHLVYCTDRKDDHESAGKTAWRSA